MGWTQISDVLSKSGMIKRRTQSSDKRKCLAHQCAGNVLWTVWEYEDNTRAKHRFIGCDLIKPDGACWGYKEMEESQGPLFYTCPLKYFDMVPVKNAGWREKVREHHAERERKRDIANFILAGLEIGDVITLRETCTPRQFVLVSKRPLRGKVGAMVYRIPRKYLLPSSPRHR